MDVFHVRRKMKRTAVFHLVHERPQRVLKIIIKNMSTMGRTTGPHNRIGKLFALLPEKYFIIVLHIIITLYHYIYYLLPVQSFMINVIRNL